MTFRQTCGKSVKDLPTHALVRFEEDCCLSVVPVKYVLESCEKGAKSKVKWSGGKVFSVEILGVGKQKEMQEEEARLISIEEEENKEVEQENEKEEKEACDDGKKKANKRKGKRKRAEKEDQKAGQKTRKRKRKETDVRKKKDKKKSTSDFIVRCVSSPPPRTTKNKAHVPGTEIVENKTSNTGDKDVPNLPQETQAKHSNLPKQAEAPGTEVENKNHPPGTCTTGDKDIPNILEKDNSKGVALSLSSSSTSLSSLSSIGTGSEKVIMLSSSYCAKKDAEVLCREIPSPTHIFPHDCCCQEVARDVKEMKEMLVDIKEALEERPISLNKTVDIPSTSTPRSFTRQPFSRLQHEQHNMPLVENDFSHHDQFQPSFSPSSYYKESYQLPSRAYHPPRLISPGSAQPHMYPSSSGQSYNQSPAMPSQYNPSSPTFIQHRRDALLYHPKSSDRPADRDHGQAETPPFSTPFLLEIKRQSSSRGKFATNMVRKVIPEEERKVSNVRGVLGKKQLNPVKLAQIKEATFQLYPCEYGESLDNCWRACCKAIDESCRRFNKTREKQKMKENAQY